MRWLGAALIALLLHFTCAEGQVAPLATLVTVDRGVVSVAGPMDEPMLAALKSQDWTGVKAIRFTSSGGLPQFSLPIAQLLARTRKPIVIHDLCGSACLDVLVIRERTSIAPDTLILLHNTPMGQALVTQDYPHIAAFLKGLGEAEQRWLQDNGVDPRLTLIAMATTMPICVAVPADDPRLADRLMTYNRFEAWGPRSTTLARFGIAAVNGWTQDTASVLRIMHMRYPAANLARLRPANEPETLPDTAYLTAMLRRVHACPANPVGVLR